MEHNFLVGEHVRLNTANISGEIDPDGALAWFLKFGDHNEVFTIKKILPHAFSRAPIMLDGILSETSFSPDELILVTEDELEAEQARDYIAVISANAVRNIEIYSNEKIVPCKEIEVFIGIFKGTEGKVLEMASRKSGVLKEDIRLIEV